MCAVSRAPRPRAALSRAGLSCAGLSRLAAPVAGALGAAVLLAGCAGLQPGAAVVVGDEVVTEDTLSEASEALCTYFEPQLEQQQQAVPLLEVRRSAAVLLALRSAVEQLAEEYDASPTSDFNREVVRLRGLAETLPEDEREAFVEVQSAQVYVPTTLSEIGSAVLGDEQADLTVRTAAGLRELADFLRESEVEFSPSIGMRVEVAEIPEEPTLEDVNALIGGFFQPTDTSASVPVTDLAVAADGDAGQAAAALPAEQRCG